MTRSELITTIAQRFPTLKLDDVEVSVATILGAITTALSDGDRAEIRGFGTFSLSYRPPRTGRNPRTGVSVAVPEKWSPHFKAGLELRKRVDGASKAHETR